jgi:hypothetical protein
MNLLYKDKQCIQHYLDLDIEQMNLVRDSDDRIIQGYPPPLLVFLTWRHPWSLISHIIKYSYYNKIYR